MKPATNATAEEWAAAYEAAPKYRDPKSGDHPAIGWTRDDYAAMHRAIDRWKADNPGDWGHRHVVAIGMKHQSDGQLVNVPVLPGTVSEVLHWRGDYRATDHYTATLANGEHEGATITVPYHAVAYLISDDGKRAKA